MGDFNYPFGDSIISQLHHNFTEVKQNSASFPVICPFLNLDKVFISKGLDLLLDFKVSIIKVNYSDHYPVHLSITKKTTSEYF